MSALHAVAKPSVQGTKIVLLGEVAVAQLEFLPQSQAYPRDVCGVPGSHD